MVLVEKWHFSNFFFLGNIGQENISYGVVERENGFLGYKNKKFKKSTNWHFSKAVNSLFWSKNGFFSIFFFLGNIGEQNVFYDILERKNVCLGYKDKKFKKSKNWHFSKAFNQRFWSKNGHFSIFFFRQYRLGSKKAIKTWSLKRRKIEIFPKGLTHDFGPKMAIFSTLFFLGNIGQENVFYDILERKNAFLGYKNKKFKKSKNWLFSKGLWSNYGHFSNFFFFGNIGKENVFYDILERKNFFLGYKNKKFKKAKNGPFFQRG